MNVFALWLAKLDGEKMATLCREFAISRKTGYKIFDRYKECGLEALTDRSRRPWRYGNQLPQPVEAAILNLKREKPYWGARKIREPLMASLLLLLDLSVTYPRYLQWVAVLD
jgi:transposase